MASGYEPRCVRNGPKPIYVQVAVPSATRRAAGPRWPEKPDRRISEELLGENYLSPPPRVHDESTRVPCGNGRVGVGQKSRNGGKWAVKSRTHDAVRSSSVVAPAIPTRTIRAAGSVDPSPRSSSPTSTAALRWSSGRCPEDANRAPKEEEKTSEYNNLSTPNKRGHEAARDWWHWCRDICAKWPKMAQNGSKWPKKGGEEIMSRLAHTPRPPDGTRSHRSRAPLPSAAGAPQPGR